MQKYNFGEAQVFVTEPAAKLIEQNCKKVVDFAEELSEFMLANNIDLCQVGAHLAYAAAGLGNLHIDLAFKVTVADKQKSEPKQ